jgi:hypothetical protein
MRMRKMLRIKNPKNKRICKLVAIKSLFITIEREKIKEDWEKFVEMMILKKTGE